MHVGVDATCWQNNRGYGRHARSLLRALVSADAANRFTFFMDWAEFSETLPRTVDVRLLACEKPTALAASANGRRSMLDMWQMSRAMSGAGCDLLLFPTIYSYVPTFSRARKLVMIHDVIAETYPELTLPGAGARLAWKAKTSLGRWQADAIATVSDYSRRAIIERFRIPADRVFVVGEAGDPVFRRLECPRITPRLAALGLDASRRAVVYVGGFGPHKNLETLIGAFRNIADQKRFSDCVLVMVGENRNEAFHSYFKVIAGQVRQFGMADRVIFTGYLPDEELVVLLNIASVLALPSLMEGFGLPAVEAAACGCPVVATVASPLPELLGEGGLYVDPLRAGELLAALETVLDSEIVRNRMRQAGLAAARRLTWEAAASQLAGVMRRVMG